MVDDNFHKIASTVRKAVAIPEEKLADQPFGTVLTLGMKPYQEVIGRFHQLDKNFFENQYLAPCSFLDYSRNSGPT